MAASFFLFLLAKKLPKNPPELSLNYALGLTGRGGTADAGKGFPVLGSTWVGLAELWRSLTIAMA